MSEGPFSATLDLTAHQADLARAFDRFWTDYVDPETGIIYDAPMRCPEVWPTPAEVAASIPTINGWDTAIENAPGEGGPLLAGLSLGAFDLTPERRRECLDHIFAGLVSLWEVPGRTGFICRGYLRDTHSFYIQTSCDQMPVYLFGLWLYVRSPHCRPEHRALVATIFDSVLRWLEGNDWSIRLADGRGGAHGGIKALRDPIIARYLALMLMAHEVTGDERWRRSFLAFREEEGRRRLADIASREKVWHPYTALYQCFALRVLEMLDPECGDFYARERRHFAVVMNAFCGAHIYPRFWPVPTSGAKTINTREDRLIDWRPAYAFAQASPVAAEPESPTFWYTCRYRLEQLRADAGVLNDGWLTYDYFTLLGTFHLAQGHPHRWLYAQPAKSLRGFFARLSTEQPLRFLPKLAFALGLRDWPSC